MILHECTEVPDENGLVTYPGSASFLPAPWLADTVIAANSMITVVNAGATVFDLEHEEDENYITSVADHAGDFILWAWGIGADRVSAISIIFDPTDTDLNFFKIERHQACIIPLRGVTWAAVLGGLPSLPAANLSNTAVLGLLNTMLSHQAEEQEEQNKILTKQLKHMIENEGTSKNRFKADEGAESTLRTDLSTGRRPPIGEEVAWSPPPMFTEGARERTSEATPCHISPLKCVNSY